MRTIKLVVFDMAGTTVDEQLLVYRVLFETLARRGLPATYEDVLRHCGGKEKRQAIADVLDAVGLPRPPELVEEVYLEFDRDLVAAYPSAKVIAMPHANEIFSLLSRHGIRVALDTGYTQVLAEQLLRKLNWRIGQEIDTLVTADQVARGRPAPDMIERAMSQFGILDPQAVAKVGDTIVDMREGRNAGCGLVVGVTTAADDRARLEAAGADHVIDSLAELANLVIGSSPG